jgi:hypothetical protein
VHLDDLFGCGKSKTRAPLGLGVGAVDLMELLEDTRLVLFGNTWPRIGDAHLEEAVDRLCRQAHFARFGELDGASPSAMKPRSWPRGGIWHYDQSKIRLASPPRQRGFDYAHRKINELAARYRLPVIHALRCAAVDGKTMGMDVPLSLILRVDEMLD